MFNRIIRCSFLLLLLLHLPVAPINGQEQGGLKVPAIYKAFTIEVSSATEKHGAARAALIAKARTMVLSRTRDAFWKSEDKSGDLLSNYAEELAAKDMHYLLRYIPSRMKYLPGGNLRGNRQLLEFSDFSGKAVFGDVDHNIHPFAKPAYLRWVDSFLIEAYGDPQLNRGAISADQAYREYLPVRDLAEYLFLNPNSPLKKGTSAQFLAGYALATGQCKSTKQAQQSAQAIKNIIGEGKFESVVQQIRDRMIDVPTASNSAGEPEAPRNMPQIGWWGQQVDLSWSYFQNLVEMLGPRESAAVDYVNNQSGSWASMSNVNESTWHSSEVSAQVAFDTKMRKQSKIDTEKRRLQNPRILDEAVKLPRLEGIEWFEKSWKEAGRYTHQKSTHRLGSNYYLLMKSAWRTYLETEDPFFRSVAIFGKENFLACCLKVITEDRNKAIGTSDVQSAYKQFRRSYDFIESRTPHSFDGENGVGNVMPLDEWQWRNTFDSFFVSSREWTSQQITGELMLLGTQHVVLNGNYRTDPWMKVVPYSELNSADLIVLREKLLSHWGISSSNSYADEATGRRGSGRGGRGSRGSSRGGRGSGSRGGGRGGRGSESGRGGNRGSGRSSSNSSAAMQRGVPNHSFHIISGYDANSDNKVSLAEFPQLWSQTPGGPSTVFSILDLNGDGFLDRQDLVK